VVALITPLINFVHSYIIGITSGVTGDVLGTVFEILYYIGSVFGYYPPLS
jgi:Na+/H+ antiporter NhaC